MLFPRLISTSAFALFMGCLAASSLPTVVNAQAPPSAGVKPNAKSALPDEALEKAREAEQHLAANEPEKAIEILKELDKKYPDQPALSRRLAEINDTRNDYGAALYYYRKYVELAGPRAQETTLARVSTLELTAGASARAADYAKSLGKATRAYATPVPQVDNALMAEAKDGSRMKITSEQQLNDIRTKGFKTAPKTPEPSVTPGPAPIVIPESLGKRPTPAPPSTASGDLAISAPDSRQASQASASPKISVVATTAPRKPDEDSILAQAFVKSDESKPLASLATEAKEASPVPVMTATPLPPPPLEPGNPPSLSANMDAAPAGTPAPLKLVPQAALTPPGVAATRTSRSAPSPMGEARVAYTRETPSNNSPRAATFFNVTQARGSQAVLSIVNDLKDAVVTLSITPPDDREVISAILAPGETKTLYVQPGSYQVTANASSTDYSPITLMNSQFDYKFQGGQQYTRRFTPTSLQQLN